MLPMSGMQHENMNTAFVSMSQEERFANELWLSATEQYTRPNRNV